MKMLLGTGYWYWRWGLRFGLILILILSPIEINCHRIKSNRLILLAKLCCIFIEGTCFGFCLSCLVSFFIELLNAFLFNAIINSTY